MKALVQFYRHPGATDGHSNKCKVCTCTNVRANRLRRFSYYRRYERSRANLPKRVAARARYIKTPRGRLARRRAYTAYNHKIRGYAGVHMKQRVTITVRVQQGRVD